jgi:hypothetical protein
MYFCPECNYTLEITKYNESMLNKKDVDKMMAMKDFDKQTGIMFKCNNCNYTEPINKSIKLYEFSVNEVSQIIKPKSQNKLICKNPILPRTKEYKCINPNCITHKDTGKKECVFYKDEKTYKLINICCVCYTNWQ